MSDLVRDIGLKIVDRRFKKLINAFARVDNHPVTERELLEHYDGADLKDLRNVIKAYGQICKRQSVGGHVDGRSGCELSGYHRVCSISINQRQKLLWLENDFAGDALERVLPEVWDVERIAESRRSNVYKERACL